jgi:hypothetical protein
MVPVKVEIAGDEQFGARVKRMRWAADARREPVGEQMA